jgi:hypothetical protein
MLLGVPDVFVEAADSELGSGAWQARHAVPAFGGAQWKLKTDACVLEWEK